MPISIPFGALASPFGILTPYSCQGYFINRPQRRPRNKDKNGRESQASALPAKLGGAFPVRLREAKQEYQHPSGHRTPDFDTWREFIKRPPYLPTETNCPAIDDPVSEKGAPHRIVKIIGNTILTIANEGKFLTRIEFLHFEENGKQELEKNLHQYFDTGLFA